MAERVGDEVGQIIEAWARERPDVDVSSIGIITPVWRLGAIVVDNRARVLAAHGLEQSHLDVLGTLRRSGPPYRLTAGELSRRCRVTPGATTQRVQAMETLGFVERVREEPDRRTVHVQLTPEGLARLDGIFADVMAGDEQLLVGLTPTQRSALEELLRTWLAGLDHGPTPTVDPEAS
ncbi:MarR family transcriptional regulator [Intrasporangium oryzae NRRL B-24470]|uniref:MarR family transcriptional regulator n=1 Tax=Intrasporangium oryzae NRRL B-24470 TaxID=1386089 RepID=W9G423_9MICO|nr:MarR family transcriptional regulator [Intrasporangium oryzae]EWT00901.1 MarR family transcriptional regulator [Intrasporangium oryzae NRRL B-24470]